MSRASLARREKRAMKAAGVEVMTRRHLPAGVEPHPVRLAHLIDLALTELDAKGADFTRQVVVTIGPHPEFPGETTIEAKASAIKSHASTCDCPVDHDDTDD